MATRRILVPLDCLLDTRLGTLSKLNTQYRDKILNEKTGYFDRVIDDYEWIEPGLTARFKEAYGTRDVETLKHSFRTCLVKHLTLLTASVFLDGGDGPLWDSLTVEVNQWPYTLSPEEVLAFEDTILEALSGMDGNDILFSPTVRMVNVPIENLTLPLIKERWESVYLYDLEEWVRSQVQSFKDESNEMAAVQVEMHVPTLFHQVPDKNELKLDTGKYMNPFEETKRNMALWINLVFNHPRLFSVVDPFNPDM